jgi:small conductance mechanosensitive channel
VLSILKLDKAVTSILAGAGIVGLALAFAFQDLAANFISGILISIRRPLSVGDVVKLSGFMGKVEVINLRDTIIRDFNGQQIIIPNKDVFQNPIENYSSSGKRRLDVGVGISYGDDLDKVRTVAVTALEKVSGRSMSDDIQLFFRDFGSSSIDFEVRIWLNSPEQSVYTLARSETIEFIKKAFDENDITIPFPIRTLDFGIKGGEKLSERNVRV